MLTEGLLAIAENSSLRFSGLRNQLQLVDQEISEKACVYATGSFGREEAGPASDLDLFIVIKTEFFKNAGISKRLLNGIDEIKLKYHLITAVENAQIAKFDGGGKYLSSHNFDDFVKALGSQEDDYNNTLTGRLLLLLESKPLVGEKVYIELLNDVISAYFRDYVGHEGKFTPSFLINDILRLWRTFCVNYEFKRNIGRRDDKIKNLKLKYSRMLTCFSAIIYLLNKHALKHTVTPADVLEMALMTPLSRVDSVLNHNTLNTFDANILENAINKILRNYNEFLNLMHKPKSSILRSYTANISSWQDNSYEFGNNFAEALALIGRKNDDLNILYRMIHI